METLIKNNFYFCCRELNWENENNANVQTNQNNDPLTWNIETSIFHEYLMIDEDLEKNLTFEFPPKYAETDKWDDYLREVTENSRQSFLGISILLYRLFQNNCLWSDSLDGTDILKPVTKWLNEKAHATIERVRRHAQEIL